MTDSADAGLDPHWCPSCGEPRAVCQCPQECPDCKGTGEIQVILCPGGKMHMLKCPTCKGTGQVPIRQLDCMSAGKKLREARLAAYQTQSEAAKRRGIDRVELAELERGDVDAWRRHPEIEIQP